MTEQDRQIGEIPRSNALAEASPMSLNELLSRDPDFGEDGGLRQQYLEKVVKALREQRERVSKAQGAPRAKAASKSPKGIDLNVVKTTSSDDLGF